MASRMVRSARRSSISLARFDVTSATGKITMKALEFATRRIMKFQVEEKASKQVLSIKVDRLALRRSHDPLRATVQLNIQRHRIRQRSLPRHKTITVRLLVRVPVNRRSILLRQTHRLPRDSYASQQRDHHYH